MEIVFEEGDLIITVEVTERPHSVYYCYKSSVHWTNEVVYISKYDTHDTPSMGYGSGGTLAVESSKIAKVMKEIFNHAQTITEKLTD